MKEILKLLNKKAMVFWVFLGAFCFQSCASTDLEDSRAYLNQPLTDDVNFQFDASAPLGFVEGSGAIPGKLGVEDCGLALSIKRKMSVVDIETGGNALVFPASVEKIIWYARFGLKGAMQQQIPRTFFIEWYGPDGKLYHSAKFKSSFWMEDLIQSSLELPKPVSQERIGRWRVRVFCKKELLDDRYFEIVKVDPKQ